MTPERAFAEAYHAATMLIAATPTLSGFAGWPLATLAPRPHTHIPAADILRSYAEGNTDITLGLHTAIRNICDYADWQQTYDVSEVGQDFLNRYGWFELVGPTGHFHSDQVRAYIAYWGENLYYPWHRHEAEELYFIIAGEARFESEGDAPAWLRPGDTRFHASNQPHAMTTGASPVLTLVLWRGAGMTGVPEMVA